MVASPDFPSVFTRLKAILQQYERGPLHADPDQPGNYELIGPASDFTRGRPLWFGAVRIGKSYVSYHIMPVYAFPDLLDGISPKLRKHMQGKSCFNFRTVDEPLFTELAELTEKGVKRFQKMGLPVPEAARLYE